MCAITGFCNFKGNIEKNINRMNKTMLHRGPDGAGVWMSANRDVVFGHRRFKVLDLSEGGAQPMKSKDGRYVITFNGEIYNHKKIADKLIKEGKITGFRSTTDTEILLEAIAVYGLKEALVISKGMFALALYDLKEQTVFLARDRIGEKPLYYGFVNKSFVFASEISAIVALDNFNNPLNTDVLGLYFAHGYIPAPYSIYQDIHKLDAGTILELKFPFINPVIYSYWVLKDIVSQGQTNLFKGSRLEAADELERLLREAIREQMVADIPVGAFHSAGIDSSTVVALMQSELSYPVKTFTIGINLSANDTIYDEAVYAKEIAAHLGCEHNVQYISEGEAKAAIPLLDSMYGEPFADTSQIPTYFVSKLAREKVRVSLSGDGGDELFCGYNSYRTVENAYRIFRRIPKFVRRSVSRLLINGPFPLSERTRRRATIIGRDDWNSAARLYMSAFEHPPTVKEISLTDTKMPYKYSEIDPFFCKEPNHQLMLMDLSMYTPDDIMVKVDRASMAVTLESRAPMFDKDVIEFAFSLPIEYKRNKKMGKLVLRDVLYRYVPKELMERPKQGFSIPINKWLKEPDLRSWAEQLIERDTLVRQGILNPDIVHQIWDDFILNNNYIPQIWYILMFQAFMQNLQKSQRRA